MSLLNDALRKKKSERFAVRMDTTRDGSASGLMSRGKRQWILVAGGIGLLAVASAVCNLIGLLLFVWFSRFHQDVD